MGEGPGGAQQRRRQHEFGFSGLHGQGAGGRRDGNVGSLWQEVCRLWWDQQQFVAGMEVWPQQQQQC